VLCLQRRGPLIAEKVFRTVFDVLNRSALRSSSLVVAFSASHADGPTGRPSSGRAAAGYKGEQKIVRAQSSSLVAEFPSRRTPVSSGTGCRFDNLMRRVGSPCFVARGRRGPRRRIPGQCCSTATASRRRLAPAPITSVLPDGRMGEVTRRILSGSAADRGLKAQCEQLRIHASTLAQVGGGPRVLYASIISSIDLNKPLSGSLTWSRHREMIFSPGKYVRLAHLPHFSADDVLDSRE